MPANPVMRLALGSLLISALLSGCITQIQQRNMITDSVHSQGVAKTVSKLETIKPKNRDRAQYLLNLGRLKSVNHDFHGSNQNLEQAKNIINALQASSVTETVGATTVNETLRSYSGTPSERVLLHLQKAFNYLQLQQLDDARVEILQADVTMQESATDDSLSGQLASAHFISGYIYELNNERDNAMISYRRAAAIMDEQQQPIPLALQDSLLLLSKSQGFKEEHEQFVQRFSHQAQVPTADERELFIFYGDGVLSNKEQRRLSVYSPQQQQHIALAVPAYSANNYRPRYLTLNIAGQRLSTQVLENIEQIARDDLKDAMPAITAAAMTRVIAKYQAAHEARKNQGDVVGLLVNIAGSLTERADLRSWSILPSSLQVARVIIPAAIKTDDIQWSPAFNKQKIVSFKQGKSLLLIANSLQQYIPPN